MNTDELIEEAKRLIADCSTYNFGLRNADRLAHEVAPQLVDALEAATRVPVQGEPNDDREALAKVMDTLAYYHCRSTNPKADHPRMGYHAMSEDQREFLQERQREAAEEIVRMIPALSRATVPDAATAESERRAWVIAGHLERDREAVKAERDAALAAIGRVAVEIEAVAGGITTSSEAAGYRNGLLRAAQIVRAALDGAPEPEEKPMEGEGE